MFFRIEKAKKLTIPIDDLRRDSHARAAYTAFSEAIVLLRYLCSVARRACGTPGALGALLADWRALRLVLVAFASFATVFKFARTRGWEI